jgi:hypothetical protein
MSKEYTEQERLVVLETKVDTIIESQKGINAKLDLLLPTLVTQPQLEKETTVLKTEIADLKIELAKAKGHNTVLNVLTGVFSAAFGVVITILIQGYFAN